MSTTKGLYDALFALSGKSGNPALVDARKALVNNILPHDLIDVMNYGLITTGIPVLRLRILTIRVLDELAIARAANVVAAEGGDAHGNDDGGGDESGGDGSKSNQSSHERTGQEGSRPAQAAQQPLAQILTSRATRSSTANGKRKGSDLSQAAKKRKNVSPEPMDDEEDLVKQENPVEEEAPGIIASDIEATSSNATTTDSNTTASSSTTTETDSDTDTSLDKDTPWKTAQKLSIMPDLDLVDSDDDDDEDFTEYLDHAKRQKNWKRTKATQIPEVKVYLNIPVGHKHGRKALDLFPIALVKQVIRKFNENYLKGAENRRAYQEMMKDKANKGNCISHYLGALQNKSVPGRHRNYSFACDSCTKTGRLCAILMEPWNEEEPYLMICPLWNGGHYYGIDFQSFDHWVRK